MKKLLILIQALLIAVVLGTAALAAEVSTKGLTVTPGHDVPGSIWTDKAEYVVGERVDISFRTDVDGYVAIYDVTPDGRSVQIWPRNGSQWVTAGRVYNLSDGNTFTAAPPYGTETLVMVVSKNKRSIDFELNLNLSIKKGLTTRIETPNNASWSTATCEIEILPAHSSPSIRIRADGSVRIFLDGREIGYGSVNMDINKGEHQLIGIKPGSSAFVHDFRVNDRSGVIDINVVTRPIR